MFRYDNMKVVNEIKNGVDCVYSIVFEIKNTAPCGGAVESRLNPYSEIAD